MSVHGSADRRFGTAPSAAAAAVAPVTPARSFNTAGPCRPGRDYMLPPLERLPEVFELVRREKYFVLHAPRQTGKTTLIREAAEELTRSGRYAALTVSCEAARATYDDYVAAQGAILDEVRSRAQLTLPAELTPPPWPGAAGATLLRAGLTAWAQSCPRPVVLFFDEIDALSGNGLYSVLSQLRAGSNDRPEAFPASVMLCGLRDVRDYKAASGGDPTRLTSPSPFNIAVESLRLGDFGPEQVAELYGQHTAETGQEFTPQGIEYAYELTGGQPWLVNALGREAVEKLGVPRSEAIGPRRLETAKERLIQQRAVHLDSLAAKLSEPRVRQVIEPVITGDVLAGDLGYNDDVCYARDLGLVARDNPVRIANPIYREVILRVLGGQIEQSVTAEPCSFVLPDGRLDTDRLLTEFVAFWRQHGEVLTAGEAYHEAAPQLVLMAFLHRVINGGGYIDRECGVGRGRIDLVVRWPYTSLDGTRTWQREAMELKVWRDRRPDPLAEALEQLDEYLARLQLATGTLVIFDRRTDAAPSHQRVCFESTDTPHGRFVTVLRA